LLGKFAVCSRLCSPFSTPCGDDQCDSFTHGCCLTAFLRAAHCKGIA
jgi:hypothetical protein